MAKKHKRIDPGRWQVLRRAVFDRDGWRCRECGKAGRLECDHVLPLGEGGAVYALGNLQTLCRGCHIEKTRGENQRAAARLYPRQSKWARAVDELLRNC